MNLKTRNEMSKECEHLRELEKSANIELAQKANMKRLLDTHWMPFIEPKAPQKGGSDE